jgi:hypothetical protein
MPTVPIRLLVVAVFSGAYLALAVAGRGGIGAFFAQPALIALSVVLVALCGEALAAGGNLSPGVCEDRRNRWVTAVFGVIGLLDAFSAGLERPEGDLGHRRRCHPLARCKRRWGFLTIAPKSIIPDLPVVTSAALQPPEFT